ncbi:MAG: hypothetical protein U1F40_00785 [Turneriella sp.]
MAGCSIPATTDDLLDAKGILADITAPAILSPAPSVRWPRPEPEGKTSLGNKDPGEILRGGAYL